MNRALAIANFLKGLWSGLPITPRVEGLTDKEARNLFMLQGDSQGMYRGCSVI